MVPWPIIVTLLIEDNYASSMHDGLQCPFGSSRQIYIYIPESMSISPGVGDGWIVSRFPANELCLYVNQRPFVVVVVLSGAQRVCMSFILLGSWGTT